MEDQSIIDLYLKREESAIEQTAQKYGAYCFSIANGILHNEEDAQESVNDTWFKTWKSIPPTIPKYLRIYLGKITRNISFDKYRANHSAKRGDGEIPMILDELAEVVSGSDNVEASYERKELIEAINGYLGTLSKRDCNVFVRRYFYGDTTKHIAKLYELKESNVLMILSRVRKKLQEYLVKKEFL